MQAHMESKMICVSYVAPNIKITSKMILLKKKYDIDCTYSVLDL